MYIMSHYCSIFFLEIYKKGQPRVSRAAGNEYYFPIFFFSYSKSIFIFIRYWTTLGAYSVERKGTLYFSWTRLLKYKEDSIYIQMIKADKVLHPYSLFVLKKM